MKSFFKNKKVLVTGGTGMIGMQLLPMLVNLGANVTSVSLDRIKAIKGVKYIKKDLRLFDNCLKICKDQEIVFHLAGVKGSPQMNKLKPASFMIPTLMFSVNMMEAARRSNVKNYLLTSSIGVYGQAQKFKEDQVWKTFPSINDKFPGWAKRICELQAEAYKIQYKWDAVSIIRPSNVYGPYDNFDHNNSMVIPSLISKASKSRDKVLNVWGDGSAIRDFIHAKDVADAMLKCIFKKVKGPINIGSGKKTSIKKIVEIISNNISNGPLKIKWGKNEFKGDDIKLMDISKSKKKLNFTQSINIKTGIIDTINWYEKNKININKKRYNPFLEKI
tara:strand:+ start:3101 stop:4096 length:996 start_codon:yes stop_codon:yes gene_type:complete